MLARVEHDRSDGIDKPATPPRTDAATDGPDAAAAGAEAQGGEEGGGEASPAPAGSWFGSFLPGPSALSAKSILHIRLSSDELVMVFAASPWRASASDKSTAEQQARQQRELATAAKGGKGEWV